MVGLYESARKSLEPSIRLPVEMPFQAIDDFAGEIDWPYIRENLDQMIEHAGGGQAGRQHRREAAGAARTAPPICEFVWLADLVDNTLEMMSGRLKHERVEVTVNIQDVTRIECVPDQISQVLLNLLINALQAIEGSGRQDGGRIDVEGA